MAGRAVRPWRWRGKLVIGNGRKTSTGAGSSGVLLATMKAQQAVAKRSVGRRVTTFDVPFFYASARRLAPSHRRDVSLRRSGFAALPSSHAAPGDRPHEPHPKLLDHCPHRPRQEHAGRSHHPALRRPVRPRDGSAGARLDGHRARARHHHQGADRGAELQGARRAGLQPQPDRHARARRLLLRGQPLAVGLRRRAAGGRRQPGRRGADGGQLLHRARPGRGSGAGAQQDGPAAGRPRQRQGRDRGRDRHRRHRRHPLFRPRPAWASTTSSRR
jgi:hypothetical protein